MNATTISIIENAARRTGKRCRLHADQIDDLSQDTFLRLLERGIRIDDDTPALAATIARNLVRDHARSRKATECRLPETYDVPADTADGIDPIDAQTARGWIAESETCSAYVTHGNQTAVAELFGVSHQTIGCRMRAELVSLRRRV